MTVAVGGMGVGEGVTVGVAVLVGNGVCVFVAGGVGVWDKDTFPPQAVSEYIKSTITRGLYLMETQL